MPVNQSTARNAKQAGLNGGSQPPMGGQVAYTLPLNLTATNQTPGNIVLPPRAVIVGYLIRVATGFTSGTTFNLGYPGGTGVELVNGLDVTSAAGWLPGDDSTLLKTGLLNTPAATPKTITPALANGGAISAGSLYVSLAYIIQ